MSKRKIGVHHYFLICAAIVFVGGVVAYFNNPSFALSGKTDGKAPVISNIQQTNVRHDPYTAPGYYYYVTITWDTDEPANSIVCDSSTDLKSPRKFTSCGGIWGSYDIHHAVDIRVEAAKKMYYVVKSADPSNNTQYSSILSYTAPPIPPQDTTPPTVSITAPANSATVSGSVPVSASASDNIGVAQVQFKVDGAVINTDTSAPHSFTWNSASVANGSHTLTATAQDAALNTGISQPVVVMVNNVASTSTSTPPTGTSTPPTATTTPPTSGYEFGVSLYGSSSYSLTSGTPYILTIRFQNMSCRFCTVVTPPTQELVFYTLNDPTNPNYPMGTTRFGEQLIDVPSLQPWATVDLMWSKLLTAGAGQYTMVTVIDPSNTVPEVNEGNNRWTYNFTITQ